MRWSSTVALGVVLMASAGGAAHAEALRAPQNVNAEPGTRQSAELATRAALASMSGDPQQALTLAEQGIRAAPNDPWPYYAKGMALTQLGQTDAAVAALAEAERRFSTVDLWGKTVAIYGRAHALSQVGRCPEARQAFEQYAAAIGPHDPKAADLARRYAAECRVPERPLVAPAGAPSIAPAPNPPAP